jgi:anti-anti-sigma regulatory factor
MIQKSEDRTLRITLPSECTIADVEAHTDRLRSQIGGVERIELNAEALEEIDTAYLQLLLSMKATLDEMDVHFCLSGLCTVLDEALRLYGVGN